MDFIGYQLTGTPLVLAIAVSLLVLFAVVVACDVLLAAERRRSDRLRARIAPYGREGRV